MNTASIIDDVVLLRNTADDGTVLEHRVLRGSISVDLVSKNLSALDPAIGDLTSLKWAMFQRNSLTALPSTFTALHRCTELWLNDNRFAAVPSAVSSSVEILYLQDNRITDCAALTRLTRLQTLSLTYNEIGEWPESLVHLPQIQTLHLGQNQIRVVPPAVGRLTSLRSLFLWHNVIDELPDEISLLEHCQVLFLSDNRLRFLPKSLGRLTALRKLIVNANALAELPHELGRLAECRLLSCTHNALTWLPFSLSRLRECKIDASNNPLELVPFGALEELFAATTALSMIREEATVVCIGLAELDLPALVMLEIIDAGWPNAIRMHAKWELICAAKHFHTRRQRCR